MSSRFGAKPKYGLTSRLFTDRLGFSKVKRRPAQAREGTFLLLQLRLLGFGLIQDGDCQRQEIFAGSERPSQSPSYLNPSTK